MKSFNAFFTYLINLINRRPKEDIGLNESNVLMEDDSSDLIRNVEPIIESDSLVNQEIIIKKVEEPKEIKVEIANLIEPESSIIQLEKNAINQYPIVLSSIKEGNFNINYHLANETRRGIMDDDFFVELWKEFPNNIINSVKVEFDNDKSYYPDIIYRDIAKNVFIDIEIDEPYTHENNIVIPIHYNGVDNSRNNTFTENGWGVIRFTEEQIVRNLNECVDLIKSYTEEKKYDFPFKQEFWTINDSSNLEKTDYRNSYLISINKVYSPSLLTVQTNFKDYYRKIMYIKSFSKERITNLMICTLSLSHAGNSWEAENEINFYLKLPYFIENLIFSLYPEEEANKILDFIYSSKSRYQSFYRITPTLRVYLEDNLIIVRGINSIYLKKNSIWYPSKFTLIIEKNRKDIKDIIEKVIKEGH